MWTELSILLLFAAIQEPSAIDPWTAVEQPNLSQELENASSLQVESLGEPARGVNTWEHWAVPNPDGQSWDELQIYFKEYYGPTWLYAMDLGTGELKKQRLADDHQFYLSGRTLGFDGKYYIAAPYRRTWSMDLFVYDPATNTLEERGEIVPGLGGEVRPLATGPDGRIYGTGTRGNQVGLYIYDPKLCKVVKDFGAVGPVHPNGAWSRYTMGVDDTHAYIASGMIPAWYLVAVNIETGEEKLLLESPTEHRMDIIESFPGAIAIIPQISGEPRKEYWLYHGKAIPKVNDNPPWHKLESPWDKAVPKPELYRDQIDPDAEGHALLWYRLSRDSDWKSITFDVPMYSHRISVLALLPDGRLFSGGEDYVGSFVFDPKTDQATLLGRNQGIAPYTHIIYDDKLYSSGYPAGPLYVFDPKLPWTVYKGGPPGHPAPDRTNPVSNPRELGSFGKDTRVAIAHSSALGADGKLYFGGFGERNYTGGGFGWYDPETGQFGGFWEPLSGYAVHWLTPALNGQLIAISTSTAPDELNGYKAPEEAKLFIYDVKESRIVQEIVPLPKAHATGLITEIASGHLLGLTVDPEKSAVLYGLNVISGEVLFRKKLPAILTSDRYWPHWLDPSYEYLALVHGPDGFVWAWLNDVLVRIDPKDASIHVVGKVDPPGYPTFAGNDLYLSGPEQLRRIKDIVPSKKGTVNE